MTVLFAMDQVAGAEYVLPLLGTYRAQGRADWRIVAAPASAAFFERHGVPFIASRASEPGWIDRTLDAIAPTKALLSTSLNSALECGMRSALATRGIPCAQLVDSWVNFSERFGAPNLQLPDLILAPDSSAHAAMIAERIPQERIVIIGQPSLEHQWQQFQAAACAAQQPDRLVIVTQPVSRYFAKTLGYDEIDFTAGSLAATASCGLGEKTDVLVHPAESLDAYRDRFAVAYPGVRWRQGGPLDLHQYHSAIGMFSTLLFLSLIVGIRTLSFQPAATDVDKCFLSSHGLIRRLGSADALAAVLSTPPNAEAAEFIQAREQLRSSIRGSHERLHQFIEHFGQNHRGINPCLS